MMRRTGAAAMGVAAGPQDGMGEGVAVGAGENAAVAAAAAAAATSLACSCFWDIRFMFCGLCFVVHKWEESTGEEVLYA